MMTFLGTFAFVVLIGAMMARTKIQSDKAQCAVQGHIWMEYHNPHPGRLFMCARCWKKV